MTLPSDVTLRRDELSDVLALSPKVVDALIATCAIVPERRDGREVIACEQLERVFRDSLLRVYQAQARAAAAPKVVEVREPEAESADQHEAVEEELSDLRLGARYIPRRQMGGVFGSAKLAVLQLSNTGLRIRHAEALRPGEEARLSFAMQNPARSVVMRARVAWTSIAQRGDGPSFYISGLKVTANAERLTEAIDLLRNARELHLDESRRTTRLPMPVSGLPDEDVVAIIRAVRKFAADPTEATRWYTRARFAIAEEEVRRAAPRGARDREEAVGVWEYLQRRVDLRAVAGVVQWIRRSQVAAT